MDDLNDILDTHLKSDFKLVAASKGKRFANYIIDIIFFYAYCIIVGIAAFVLSDTLANMLAGMDEDGLNPLVEIIASVILLTSYYTLIEFPLKGKTIGKFITKTRTVNLDGSRPDFTTILKRSLCRVVPFDAFSFLGDSSNGWHDKWSKTMVIDEKLSQH